MISLIFFFKIKLILIFLSLRNKELSISQPVQPLQDVIEDNKKDPDSDLTPEQRPELLEGEGKVANNSKNEAVVSDLLDLNFGPSMASINREDLAGNIEIEAETFQSSWLSLNEGYSKNVLIKIYVILVEY